MTGKISVLGETKSVGSNGFTIREFVVEEQKESKYPNLVPFKLSKDNCELLDNYKVGDLVQVSFYLNGRKWTDKNGVDKYFASNDVVKIEALSGSDSDCPPPAEAPDDMGDAPAEDLPF